MIETELRRNVAWLIAIRVVISTMLLGSATFVQITAPGSFAVDPFFFLIGLTYALTIGYALTLRFVERHRWLVDLQLGRRRAASSRRSSTSPAAITSYFTSLYVLPIIAGEHGPVPPRRPAGGDAERGALRRPGAGAVPGGVGPAAPIRGWRADRWRCRRRSVAQYTVALNVFGFFAVALLERLARRRPAIGRRAARAGVDRDRRPAGAQPARHRQPAERPGDHRPAAAHPDVQPRAPKPSPASPSDAAVGRPIAEVLQLPAR